MCAVVAIAHIAKAMGRSTSNNIAPPGRLAPAIVQKNLHADPKSLRADPFIPMKHSLRRRKAESFRGMGEISDNGRENADLRLRSAGMSAPDVNGWFVLEVLPLEAALMQFLRRSWPNKSDLDDLAQEVYARVYEAACEKIPEPVKPFVFAIARNLLIDRVRHEHVVPIEAVADLEALGVALDAPGPDRSVMAQDELRRLQAALDRLPPRCREVIVMGRIEGLSGREISQRLNIGASTVSEHLANGMNALAEILFGDDAEFGRKP